MLGIEQYKKIYGMLDKVSPVPYDCGSLCNSICCRGDSFSGEDPYIYLLPGEKEYLEYAGCKMKIVRRRLKYHDLPSSWGKYVYTAECSQPENCNRSVRPIQCRTFPITPHITETGELLMIYCDVDLPYVCPLLEEEKKLSDDFLAITYEAWKLLTEDGAIRDLVEHDSRERDKNGVEKRVVYRV